MSPSTAEPLGDRLLVVEGTGYDPRLRGAVQVLHTELAPEVIAWASELTASLDAEGQAWMEWPQVSLVFLRQRRFVAEYGVLAGGEYLRTPDGDKRLRRSAELLGWLQQVGAA